MIEPDLRILGLFRLPLTGELVEQQMAILYPDVQNEDERAGAFNECFDLLQSAVLIELIVENPDARFRLEDFTQRDPGRDPDSWQAPYADAFLSPDGESVISRDNYTFDFREFQCLRIAFYLHFFDPERPLETSYGPKRCPALQDMPERLQRLIPYPLLD